MIEKVALLLFVIFASVIAGEAIRQFFGKIIKRFIEKRREQFYE